MDLGTLLQLYYDTGHTAGAIEGTKNVANLMEVQKLQIAARDEAKRKYQEELRDGWRAMLRGTLTETEILEALEDSNRWGVSSQPEIEAVARDLDEIGITSVYMEQDNTLILELCRDFDLNALLRLSASADSAETKCTDSGHTLIVLWWN